jgi:hypothetical protein
MRLRFVDYRAILWSRQFLGTYNGLVGGLDKGEHRAAGFEPAVEAAKATGGPAAWELETESLGRL